MRGIPCVGGPLDGEEVADAGDRSFTVPLPDDAIVLNPQAPRTCKYVLVRRTNHLTGHSSVCYRPIRWDVEVAPGQVLETEEVV